MRVTKESSDPEALDGEGKCKDIKTVKAKDKITISRFDRSGWTIKCLESGCHVLKHKVVKKLFILIRIFRKQ